MHRWKRTILFVFISADTMSKVMIWKNLLQILLLLLPVPLNDDNPIFEY